MSNTNFITFVFSDGRHIPYDYTDILELGPSYFCHKSDETSIEMPQWLTQEDLSCFISIFHKGTHCIGEYTDIHKLLRISEFFENDSYSIALINEAIMPKLSLQNSLSFLQLAYNKLSDSSRQGMEIDGIWFDFFCKSLENVGRNLSYYFRNNQLNIIKMFDRKILDELYEKWASHLISTNYLIIEDSTVDTSRVNLVRISTLEAVMTFLSEYRKQASFYDLITNEYMKICSEDNINELNSLPNPTFQLKLQVNEIDDYYQDFTVDLSLNSRQITFIIFYRRSDDSFNVAFKLVDNNKNITCDKQIFKIISFLSSVTIDELSNNQINVKSISNNKSMHNIFKVNSCKNLLLTQGNNKYLNLKIYLKPCFLHSVLTSYLLVDFAKLYRDVSIVKISKQLLILILKNKTLKLSEDKIVSALLNWLNDEINIKEDITEIVENIKWENVSLGLLFEFVIKYGKNIINEDIEHIFIKSFEEKGNCDPNAKSFNHNVMEEMIKAAKRANYSELYSENKKLNKLVKFNSPTFLKDYTSDFNKNINSLHTNKSINSLQTHIHKVNVKGKTEIINNSLTQSMESNSIKTQPNGNRNKSSNIQKRNIPNCNLNENKEFLLQGNNNNEIYYTNPLSRSRSKNKVSNHSHSHSLTGKQIKPSISYITNDYMKTKKDNEKAKMKKNKSFVNVNINTKLTISNNMSFYGYPNNNQEHIITNTNQRKDSSQLVTSQSFIHTSANAAGIRAMTQANNNVSSSNIGHRPQKKISLLTQQMNKMKIVTKKESKKNINTPSSSLWNNKYFNQ